MKFFERNVKLKGHWKLDVYRGDLRGEENLLQTMEYDNLITTAGKGVILDRIFGLSSVAALNNTTGRIGVGTLNTAAAVGDTGLTGGVFVAYDAIPTRTGLVVTCIATFGTGTANIVWAELGMDNSTTLFNRIAPIGPFTKSSAVSIVVTVTVTQN